MDNRWAITISPILSNVFCFVFVVTAAVQYFIDNGSAVLTAALVNGQDVWQYKPWPWTDMFLSQ